MARRINKRANIPSPIISAELIDRAIFWITLGALFSIPLLFNYFSVVAVYDELRLSLLHFAAGSVVVLWLWQAVIVLSQTEMQSQKVAYLNPRVWAGSNIARWTVTLVGLFVLVQVVSTLLSPIPMISFFGGDDTRSGHNLYDSLSMTVLLIVVVFRMRTERNLILLGYVLVASGTIAAIYGITQHFGWNPTAVHLDRTRVISSFGNTLNFSAYMVMSIPATLAIWHIRSKRPNIWISAITLVLAFQISGLVFSGSRGPVISAVVGIAVYFLIASFRIHRHELLRVGTASLVAVGIALIIIAIPSGGSTSEQNASTERILSIGEELPVGFSRSDGSTDLRGGLNGRISTWRSVLELATKWEVPAEEPSMKTLLRPAFGLGPEMLVYSFPFVGEPQSHLLKMDHAHNFELNVLAELGYLGLSALIALAALVLAMAIRIVKLARSQPRGVSRSTIAILFILPSLIGKLVEVQVGVPRVSDMAMMFALFGAVIAVHELLRIATTSYKDGSESKSQKTALSISISGSIVYKSTIIVAVVASIAFLSVFVGWDLRRLSASRHLAAHLDDPVAAFNNNVWQEAQSRAPERSSITINLYRLYAAAANNQQSKGNEDRAVELILAGRNLLLEYEKYDPFQMDTQIGLAQASSRMAEWGYSEYQQDLIDRYVLIVDRYPNKPSLIGTAATVMSSFGNHELAIDFADRAIATEATTQPWSKAWYAKGRSLYLLGREAEALDVLQIATTKDPESEGAIRSEELLAQIFELQGSS